MATKNVALTDKQRGMIRELLTDFIGLCGDTLEDAEDFVDAERVRKEVLADLKAAQTLKELLK